MREKECDYLLKLNLNLFTSLFTGKMHISCAQVDFMNE